MPERKDFSAQTIVNTVPNNLNGNPIVNNTVSSSSSSNPSSASGQANNNQKLPNGNGTQTKLINPLNILQAKNPGTPSSPHETNLNVVPMDLEEEIHKNQIINTRSPQLPDGTNGETEIKPKSPPDSRNSENSKKDPSETQEVGEVILIEDDDTVPEDSNVKAAIERPIDVEKEKSIPECKECREKFEKSSLYIKHQYMKHSPNLIICNVCKIGFFNDIFFKDHNQYVHGL